MDVPPKLRLTKWQWAVAVLALALVLVSSVVDRYLPWFQAQIWYLRHLSGVAYMGKVIPVPRGMVQARKPGVAYESAFFLQYPPTTRQAGGGDEWDMFFTKGRLPSETPQDAVRRIETNLRDFAARTGVAFGPAFSVKTQEGKGRCYTTTLAPGESISTTCLLFNAQWSVSYTGPPGHEKEFFKVLASIHEAKK